MGSRMGCRSRFIGIEMMGGRGGVEGGEGRGMGGDMEGG